MIYTSFSQLTGKTPLMEFKNYEKSKSLSASILGKLEFFNPAGSIKDRVAVKMIDDGIKAGLVNSDTTIIEPTSGNTGIGLAAVAASYGMKCILTMPETMSPERIKLLKAYGAQIVLTNGELGMKGAIDKAEELHKATNNSYIPGQFVNPSNPETHVETTGPEIWEDTQGNVDFLVAGVGTGGTITGIGRYLKSKNPNLKVVAVEPFESQLLAGGTAGAHGLQGIGANFIPEILDRNVYDEIIPVKTPDAIKASKELTKLEGIFTGITSGAALYAGTLLANRPENKGKNIVVILPDSGSRYLSTALCED